MISEQLKTSMSIHHIVLTVVDTLETEKFYTKIFGKPARFEEHFIMYTVGQTLFILKQKDQKNPLSEKFDPTVIGLEHIAFGIKTIQELEEIETVLNKNDIQHSGIKIDNGSGKSYIWLNDPSNIRIEFYL